MAEKKKRSGKQAKNLSLNDLKSLTSDSQPSSGTRRTFGQHVPAAQSRPATRSTSVAGVPPKFVNPYNFVRVGNPSERKAPLDHSRFQGVSGQIVCRLRNETPMFIPDSEETFLRPLESTQPGQPARRNHKYMDFCRLPDGTLVIPGTSLKGMLRSLCEALSNSCWSQFDDGWAVYRDLRDFAVHQRKANCGILRNAGGSWTIDPCEEVVFPRDIRRVRPAPGTPPNYLNLFVQGQRVWVQFRRAQRNNEVTDIAISAPAVPGWSPGTLYKFPMKGIFNAVPNSRPPWRVVIPSGRTSIPVPDSVIRQHQARDYYEALVVSAERKPPNGTEKWWNKLDDEFVYFETDRAGQIFSLGKNFRYKWAYNRVGLLKQVEAMRASLPSSGFLPCNQADQLCMACRMFGFVSGESTSSMAFAGKISIGMARLQGNEPDLQTVKLAILNTPKPSFRQFYLIPKVKYDTGGVTHTDIDERTYDWQDGVLRGRKMYWHQEADDAGYTSNQETPQNSTVRLLPPLSDESYFEFTLDFENLADDELGCLLFALDIANQFPEARHKLGMGKPLGLGTVKIEIHSAVEIDRVSRYGSFESDGAGCLDLDRYAKAFVDRIRRENGGRTFESIENIADLRLLLVPFPGGTSIQYPPGGYTWFMNNLSQPLCTIQETVRSRNPCQQS